MTGDVKGAQQARVAATEERILLAARELFLRDGYHRTTLTEVADRAGVSHRTVYVRFGTKAALLRRVVDVAIGGDARPVAVAERDWFRSALTADSVDERVGSMVAGTTGLMERTGGLFEVVLEAQWTEPDLAGAMQAGREATRQHLHAFVRALLDDGLVESPDPEWLAETVALVCHAETFLLLRRTTGGDLQAYRQWLHQTLRQLLSGPSTAAPPR